MTAALSNDLRERVVGAIEAGESCRLATTRFGVVVSSAVKWHQRYRATGSVAPGKMGAKIKHWMRAAQKRTIEDTSRYLGHLVSTIQPTECSNYLENAGYASVKT